MVQAEDNGDRLTDLHIRTLSVNTLAGSLSTTYMLGNLLYRLVSDPSFDGELRADRAVIPEAVEESLRLEPPVLFLFRTAKADTDIGGAPVHAGERIIVGIASGNRDEQVYECPNEFRLDRGITSGASPTTSPSASVRTSASASTSRAWRDVSCSRPCSTGSRPGRSGSRPVTSCTSCRCSSSTGRRRSRFPSRDGRPVACRA